MTYAPCSCLLCFIVIGTVQFHIPHDDVSGTGLIMDCNDDNEVMPKDMGKYMNYHHNQTETMDTKAKAKDHRLVNFGY